MKMKLRIISAIFLFSGLYTISFSQVTDVEKTLRTQPADSIQGWIRGGIITVSIAQTSLTNWVAGGQNSFAANGLLSSFANYRKGKSVWVNSLDVGFGLLKQGASDYRKTDDKFDLLSKYGYKAFKNIYYAVLFNFKTQLSTGYKYTDTSKEKISDPFSPAYIILALGLDYKPSDHLSAFIAPLTGKITIVNDKLLSAQGAYGVKPGQKSLTELGGYFRAIYTKNDFKNELLKNVTFTSKLDLFSNYLKNPQNIVINWETLLAFKVNKFLSANINTQLIYDDKIKIPVIRNGEATTIGSLIQFKEILGVGFSYSFKSFNK